MTCELTFLRFQQRGSTDVDLSSILSSTLYIHPTTLSPISKIPLSTSIYNLKLSTPARIHFYWYVLTGGGNVTYGGEHDVVLYFFILEERIT